MFEKKLCRTCLKEKDADLQFIDIFDAHDVSGELIGSLLIDCTDIDLSMDDNMPNIICKECYNKLMKWYEFREMAKSSNNYLVDLLFKMRRPAKQTKQMPKSTKPKAIAKDEVVVIDDDIKTVAIDGDDKVKIEPKINIKIVEINGQKNAKPRKIRNNDEVVEIVEKPIVPIIKIKKVGAEETPEKIRLKSGIQIKKVESLASTSKQNSSKRKVNDSAPTGNASLVQIKKVKVPEAKMNYEILDFNSSNETIPSNVDNETIVIIDEEDETVNNNDTDVIDNNGTDVIDNNDTDDIDNNRKEVLIDLEITEVTADNNTEMDNDNSMDNEPLDNRVSDAEDTDDDGFYWKEEPEIEPKRRTPEPENNMQFCCMCVEVFENKEQLMQHMQEQHTHEIAKMKSKASKIANSHLFKCEFCTLRQPTLIKLYQHQKQYRLAKPCVICGIRIPNRKEAMHKRTYHSQKDPSTGNPTTEISNHPCCMCKETFEDRHDLIRHAESVHENDILNVYVKTNMSGEVLYQCDICTMQMRSYKQLQWHRRRYQNVKQCEHCGEFVPTFKSWRHSESHLDKHERFQYQCDICKKFIQSYAAIKIHMEIHDTSIRLECPLEGCNAVRTTERAMKYHLKEHKFKEEEKTLKCLYCPRLFHIYKRDKLRIHQRIHTGEKCFQCRHCEKKFTDRTDWHRHEWVHTGDSPYRCSKCNKMFLRKKTLVNHEAVCTLSNKTDKLDAFENNSSGHERRSARRKK